MARPVNHHTYIASFPAGTQVLLNQLCSLAKVVAPDAAAVISYSMPAFKFQGKLLFCFAGYDRHIGFYPGSSAIAAFQKEISGYKNAKGSVQFPLGQPLPDALITNIIQFRMAEILTNPPKKRK